MSIFNWYSLPPRMDNKHLPKSKSKLNVVRSGISLVSDSILERLKSSTVVHGIWIPEQLVTSDLWYGIGSVSLGIGQYWSSGGASSGGGVWWVGLGGKDGRTWKFFLQTRKIQIITFGKYIGFTRYSSSNQSGLTTQFRTHPRATQQGHVKCRRYVTVPAVPSQEAIPEEGG